MFDIKRPDFMRAAAVKQGHNIFAEIGIALVLAIVACVAYVILLIAVMFAAVLPFEKIPSSTESTAVFGILSSAVITAVAVLYCRIFEKRGLDTMGFSKKFAARKCLVGVIGGLAAFGAVCLVCRVFGGVETYDDRAPYQFITLLLYCVSFAAAGISETAFDFGYLMVSVSRKYSVFAAVTACSLLYAIINTINIILNEIKSLPPSIAPARLIIAFLSAFLYEAGGALLAIRCGSVLTVAAFRSIWKIAQYFWLNALAFDADALITGGDYGMSRGIAAVIVFAFISAALLYSIKSKSGLGVPPDRN